MTTGAASVSPYPSYTVTPASANRASTGGGSGAAPDSASRTLAKPSASPGWSAHCTYIAGTAGTFVTRCRAISSSDPAASNGRPAPRSRRPRPACPRPGFSPYAWKSGMASSSTSAGVATVGRISPHCSRLASSARWVSIAPRGLPLVPLV